MYKEKLIDEYIYIISGFSEFVVLVNLSVIVLYSNDLCIQCLSLYLSFVCFYNQLVLFIVYMQCRDNVMLLFCFVVEVNACTIGEQQGLSLDILACSNHICSVEFSGV